jgi:hypothetical protein
LLRERRTAALACKTPLKIHNAASLWAPEEQALPSNRAEGAMTLKRPSVLSFHAPRSSGSVFRSFFPRSAFVPSLVAGLKVVPWLVGTGSTVTRNK